MVDQTAVEQVAMDAAAVSLPEVAAGHSGGTNPPGWANACETFIKQLFANRFLWLVLACAMYINCQLTYVQWSTARYSAQQFDTLDLMSHLLVVIEASAIAILMIGFGAAGAAVARWRAKFPRAKFPYLAYACALQLVAGLAMLLQLLCLLYPHSYPQLRTEGISVPLMLLQRALLIYLVLNISTQLAWIVRQYTNLSWQLTAILILLCQVSLGYALTVFSLKNETLLRLNSVFYYGYLWRFFPEVPNLQHSNMFHNIQMPFFGIYAGTGILLSAILTFLWLPRAVITARRETLSARTDSSS